MLSEQEKAEIRHAEIMHQFREQQQSTLFFHNVLQRIIGSLPQKHDYETIMGVQDNG